MQQSDDADYVGLLHRLGVLVRLAGSIFHALTLNEIKKGVGASIIQKHSQQMVEESPTFLNYSAPDTKSQQTCTRSRGFSEANSSLASHYPAI